MYDLKDYHSGSGGLFGEVFNDRYEQTLGGTAIGITRDLIDSPEGTQQKIERAKENDQAAYIASDTAAIIPKYRALTAGLVRATLLVNPHQSMQENFGSFGLNMAEGAALNKVGKMVLPGSRVQATLARNIGSPLGREITTHVLTGGSFGAVKSGFDRNNWVDENGSFAPGSLATSMLKSTVAGATINVPAGIVGLRVMKGSLGMMTETGLSRRVSTTIAGMGSGYTSGAVFGGIDAVSQGKSLSETLADMHFAGKVGMVTGAVVAGSDSGRLRNQMHEITAGIIKANSVSVRETRLGGRQERTQVQEQQAGERRRRWTGPSQDEIIEEQRITRRQADLVEEGTTRPKLDFEPHQPRLAEMHRRLSNPRVETEKVRFTRPDAKVRFDSFDDWFDHTEVKDMKVRVYDVEGHSAKLVVEESLAQRYDKQRPARMALESMAAKNVAYDYLPADKRHKINMEWNTTNDQEALLRGYLGNEGAKESVPVIRARLELLKGTASRTAMPEDFVLLMDEVPNRGKVNRVLLVDEPNPQDAWMKSKFDDPFFESAASASHDGTITFYLTKGNSQLRSVLRTFMGHEFAHIAMAATPVEEGLFSVSALVDKDIPNISGSRSAAVANDPKANKYYAREYATKTPGEDAAVHMGEEMLAPTGDRFYVLADNAPVRTVLLARSLTKVMAQARPGEQGTHAADLWNRIRYVETNTFRDAIRLLERRVKNGTAAQQAASAEILGHLGDPERHVPLLRRLAADPKSNVVPDGVDDLVSRGYTGAMVETTNGGTPVIAPKTSLTFEPQQGYRRTVSDVAFDALLRLHEGNPQNQLALLVNEAKPNSPNRALAQTRLAQATDPMADFYRRFAHMAGDGNKLPELLLLMREMPDAHGAQMVFDEALGLGRESPRFRASLIEKGLESPKLWERALGLLDQSQVPSVQRQLGRISRQSWDKASQQKAQTMLSRMGFEADIVKATEMMQSRNPKIEADGIEIISSKGIKDHRLIQPLLQVMANGSDAAKQSARTQLSKYAPQLVRYYAQSLSREGVDITPAMITELYRGRVAPRIN